MENAGDLIKRGITPFYYPGGEFWIPFLAASPNPNYQDISKILVIPKDWDEYEAMTIKMVSTGLYAQIGGFAYENWYKSSETIGGFNAYAVHLLNKKWPLRKV